MGKEKRRRRKLPSVTAAAAAVKSGGISGGGPSLASNAINEQNWKHTGPLERYGRRIPGAHGLQMNTVIPRTNNGYSIWSRGQFQNQNNRHVFPYLNGLTPRIILKDGVHLWIRPNHNNTSVAYGF